MVLSDAPAPVRDAVAAMFDGWTGALAAGLAEAGAVDPQAEAQDRVAAVQGALVLARAGGDTAAFARAVQRLAATP